MPIKVLINPAPITYPCFATHKTTAGLWHLTDEKTGYCIEPGTMGGCQPGYLSASLAAYQFTPIPSPFGPKPEPVELKFPVLMAHKKCGGVYKFLSERNWFCIQPASCELSIGEAFFHYCTPITGEVILSNE